MKKISFVLLIIVFFFVNINKNFAQKDLCSLEVKIIGLKNNNGKILLQLFNNKDESIYGKVALIKHQKCYILIPKIKEGKYSIRYFHDENGNDKLDTNWLGIPIEGYGFSNNTTSVFGIPSIEKRIININKNKKIVLTINY